MTDHTPMQLEKYYTCYIERRLHIPYNPASARLTTGLLILIQGNRKLTPCRAVASGPAGPTLVGPLFGSKMRECLDDSYARAHALTVAAVFHSVDRGMDSSFTEITTQKFADFPERPLSL